MNLSPYPWVWLKIYDSMCIVILRRERREREERERLEVEKRERERQERERREKERQQEQQRERERREILHESKAAADAVEKHFQESLNRLNQQQRVSQHSLSMKRMQMFP